MTDTKRTGKNFSIVFTVALIILMIAAVIPCVNGASAVNLGSAGNYVILTKSGISTTGATSITGNIAVSPIAAAAITGFGLSKDASNQFSTSSLVTGRVYAADYAAPTPATLTTAVSDMEAAYTSAAGQVTPTATELYAGNLGGRTLAPGVYKWSSGVLIPSATTLTLDGQGNGGAVWVFQIAGDLTMNSGSQIVLSNGAQADNVFWQVAGPSGVIIGSGAHAEGTILAQKAITLNSGASLHGRALAQTAVTMIANTITGTSQAQTVVPIQTLAPGQTVAPTQTLAPGQTATPTPAQTGVPVPTQKYAVIPTSAPTDLKTTVSANVGGDSDINEVEVIGTGNNRLIVTGTTETGPAEDVPAAPGTVYQYVSLVPSRYSTVDNVEISFFVRHLWLDEKHIDATNIVLYRLDGTTWVPLPTTLVEREGARTFFKATSPSFSLFAITGLTYPVTVQTSAPVTATPVQAPITEKITVAPTQPAPLTTAKSPLPVWIPVIAVIGSLLIMTVISGRRRKNS